MNDPYRGSEPEELRARVRDLETVVAFLLGSGDALPRFDRQRTARARVWARNSKAIGEEQSRESEQT